MGWASDLLTWSVAGPLLTSEVLRARYFIRIDAHEVIAWGDLRDLGGRRRVDIGSFPTVALARAACERHAAAVCRRDRDARGPVDVRIAPGRRRRAERSAHADRDPGEALDSALAAVSYATEDEG